MAKLAVTSISRDDNILVVATADGTIRRSITLLDTVVSVAPSGYKKIENIYYDLDNNRLVVVYEA